MNTTVQEFRKAINHAYSNWNFIQFCAAIGEPTKHGSSENSYAIEKWQAFLAVVNGLDKLGTFADAIIGQAEKEMDKNVYT